MSNPWLNSNGVLRQSLLLLVGCVLASSSLPVCGDIASSYVQPGVDDGYVRVWNVALSSAGGSTNFTIAGISFYDKCVWKVNGTVRHSDASIVNDLMIGHDPVFSYPFGPTDPDAEIEADLTVGSVTQTHIFKCTVGVPYSTNKHEFSFSPELGPASTQSTSLGNRLPVVLVHGSENGESMETLNYWYWWIRDYFNSKVGDKVKVYRFVYDSNRHISESGDALANLIVNYSDFQGKKVFIMAHSMGGLVARYALNNNPALLSKTIRLVTLATPHLGSPGADPAWVKVYAVGQCVDLPYSSGNLVSKWDLYTKIFSADLSSLELAWYAINDIPSIAYGQLEAGVPPYTSDAVGPTMSYPFCGTSTVMQSTASDGLMTVFGGYTFGTVGGAGTNAPSPIRDKVYHDYNHILGSPISWPDFVSDHCLLRNAQDIMSGIQKKDGSYFLQNDGMVPIESSLFASHSIVESERVNLSTGYSGVPVDHASVMDNAAVMDKIWYHINIAGVWNQYNLVAPSLDSQNVSPASGTPANTFTYSVHYKDPSGNGPQSAKVYIGGNENPLVRTSGSDADGTYSRQNSNIGLGVNSYYFSFTAHDGTVVRFPPAPDSFSGPTVSSGSPSGGGNILVYSWVRQGVGTLCPTFLERYSVAPTHSVGDQCWFTAYPSFGWRISRWEKACNPSDFWNNMQPVDQIAGNSAMITVSPSTISPPENAVVCYFERIDQNQRILTVSKSGPGQVSPAEGPYSELKDSSVTLTATETPLGSFSEWRVGGILVSTNLTLQVTMDDDKDVTAIFAYKLRQIYTNDLPCIADAGYCPMNQYANIGNDSVLFVANRADTDWIHRSALLKFDIDRVPVGTVVSQMILNVYNGSTLPGADRLEVHKNLGNWTEDNIAGLLVNDRDDGWKDDSFCFSEINTWCSIDLTTLLPAALKWIDDPHDPVQWRTVNTGLRLMIDDSFTTPYSGYYQFTSINNSDSNHWPFLRVVYEGRRLIPSISILQTNLLVELMKGQGTRDVVLSLYNSGEGTLSYNTISATNWLALSGDVTATSTGEVHQVTATLNESGLNQGTYLSSITITDGNASNSPVTIPVTFTVSGPSIGVNPSSFSAEMLQGNNPDPVTFNLRNSGKGVLDYSISTSDSWLSLSTNSGSLATGQVQQVNVQFNAAGLAGGVYTNIITVTNTAGYALSVGKVTVVLTVLTQQVETPFFYPAANVLYLSDQPVSIFSTTDGAVILYTKDGSMPTNASALFDGTPIVITNDTLLIAKAWNTGMYRSQCAVGSYKVYPTTVSATDGRYWHAVGVAWTPVPAATNYQVWRNTVNDPGSALQIGATSTTNLFDTSPGVCTNYYWIRALLSDQVSGFSFCDTGSVMSGASIASPVDGAVFNDPSGIPISSSAKNDGSVTQVIFCANGVQIGPTIQAPPFSVQWSNATTGSYALTVLAWDQLATCYTSEVVNVTVTRPVISVTPGGRAFSLLEPGQTADLSFTVQNTANGMFSGALSGSASVSSPFSVFSGGSYNIAPGSGQVVTVRFSPSSAANYKQNVTFTGGGGAACEVTGICRAYNGHIPNWALGTFNGYVEGCGAATMNVTARGSIVGKITAGGSNYTFSSTSFAVGSRAAAGYSLQTVAKVGKATLPLRLRINYQDLPNDLLGNLGVVTGTLGSDKNIVMYRNVWKDSDMAGVPAKVQGYYTATLPGGDAYGSGYLAFTLDTKGNVKTVGKTADGTAVSLSSTLLVEGPDTNLFVVIYSAPTAYKGGYLFGLASVGFDKVLTAKAAGTDATFAWVNLNPQATETYGDGFDRSLDLVGGWYDKVGNLARYYTNNLTVGVGSTTAPDIMVGTESQDAVCWNPDGQSLSILTSGGVLKGIAALKAGAPAKIDGAWTYDATNAVGLTFGLTRATGIYKGSFKAWFDYGTVHLAKPIAFEGMMTPVRADRADGIEGRGFYLWQDKATTPAPYTYKTSYDFSIQSGP